jgi:hypothetical protein
MGTNDEDLANFINEILDVILVLPLRLSSLC